MLHATPARNAAAIVARGIRTAKSRCAVPAVWLVTEGMMAQAIGHAARRHGIHASRVAVFVVEVPRSWLRRGRKRGVWYCRRDISACSIRAVFGFIHGAQGVPA